MVHVVGAEPHALRRRANLRDTRTKTYLESGWIPETLLIFVSPFACEPGTRASYASVLVTNVPSRGAETPEIVTTHRIAQYVTAALSRWKRPVTP